MIKLIGTLECVGGPSGENRSAEVIIPGRPEVSVQGLTIAECAALGHALFEPVVITIERLEQPQGDTCP